MSVKKINLINETKWEVRVYGNGRSSKRLTRRFDKKVDAESFLVNFHREQKEKRDNPFHTKKLSEVTFKDEAGNWLEDGRIRFSASHLERVRIVLRKILPLWSDLTLDKFTPEFLSQYQRLEKAKGLKNETVNKQVQVAVSILNFSVKQRRVPFNPAKGYKKLGVGGGEMLFWNQEEAKSFLNFANSRYPKGHSERWIFAVYLLALNTGLRAGEIWGLKVLDI